MTEASIGNTPAAATLDNFLDVEFLHSLGCYSDAGEVALGCELGSIPDAGGALNRTRALNALLKEKRDNSSEPFRHPDPKGANPTCAPKGTEKSEARGGGELEQHEQGLLLSDTGMSRKRLRRITDFYSTGIVALDTLLEGGKSKKESKAQAGVSELKQFGDCLFWDREPASSFREVNEEFRKHKPDIQEVAASVRERIEGKSGRYLERRDAAETALKPQLTHRGVWDRELAEPYATAMIAMDLRERSGYEDCVTPGFVLQCLVAAHLRLHEVEHFLSLPFEEAMTMSSVEIEEAKQWLREAESLNTFVYVSSRSMPWIFAEGEDERATVVKECSDGFGAGDRSREDELGENQPAVFRAVWRSHRLSFIALHRRAFGHSLRDALDDEGFNDAAFKDFHKLQGLLRVQRRALRRREQSEMDREREELITPIEFLAGFDALAETHIGDLYRADHAHPVALKHFCGAADRLERLSDELLDRAESSTIQADSAVYQRRKGEGPAFVASVLQGSRWRVHLMMSKGKGFYEAGNLKRSIKWLIKSWSAFLVLVDRHEDLAWRHGKRRGSTLTKDQRTELFGNMDSVVDLLEVIKNDPDFSKADLERAIKSVVDGATKVNIPKELSVIGSEILLRLGHVMFVLRLDARNGKKERHKLAEQCLRRARDLDHKSTLVLADQLKILHSRKVGVPKRNREFPDTQWPYGRGNPEQMIRMIEYHLLRWLAVEEDLARKSGGVPNDGSPQRQDRHVARDLIAGLLTHTDSINVRQSQVYRYLMQPNRPARRIAPAESWKDSVPTDPLKRPEETAIEFVCLRRYSSFFPFVPRPSAFRSLGGGYLLRLHHRDESCPNPFGIAVDPGPDYIENLYRCGFGLGDINMIVLTHDHPDHSVDLTPILSLMGYRMKHGDETFKPPDRRERDAPIRRLLIVGNESVARQLSFFNKPHVSGRGAGEPEQMRPDAVQVVSFDQFDAFFRETMEIRERNQQPEVAIPDELRLKPVVSVRHPDGFGMLSYGFRLSLGDDGPSVGLTSDTGGFLLQAVEEGASGPRWKIRENDQHKTMGLSGHRTWREHWKPVLESDVLIPHVSGLPLAQLLVLANEGKPEVDWSEDPNGEELERRLKEAWNGLEKNIRKQVSFAFWLPENGGKVSLPLEPIEGGTKWPKGHLYLIGLLEFARAYKRERERVDRPGLLLVGELREELGSLRGKIATSLNEQVFSSNSSSGSNGALGCRALTTDVGLRMMITREKGETQVRVLCSTCDLDNDRTRQERFHDPSHIREVCVKGENEGMFYNCSNHDPSQQTHPVFLERVERYDVFSATPNP
jgi:hypothetical protein